jgi:hypothetical protein
MAVVGVPRQKKWKNDKYSNVVPTLSRPVNQKYEKRRPPKTVPVLPELLAPLLPVMMEESLYVAIVDTGRHADAEKSRCNFFESSR